MNDGAHPGGEGPRPDPTTPADPAPAAAPRGRLLPVLLGLLAALVLVLAVVAAVLLAGGGEEPGEPAPVRPAAEASDAPRPTWAPEEEQTVTVTETSTVRVEAESVRICLTGDGYGVSHLAVSGGADCARARQVMGAIVAGRSSEEDVLDSRGEFAGADCAGLVEGKLRCDLGEGGAVWLWNEAPAG